MTHYTGIPGLDALIQSLIYTGVGLAVFSVSWMYAMGRKQVRRHYR